MIVINLVAPKAAAKRELLFSKPASDEWHSWVYCTSKSDISSTRKCNQIILFVNLVTPEAEAQHELMLNKPASGLLNI